VGMFDSVNVKCPHCGEYNELQSKAGDCILNTYLEYEVPCNIAMDLEGTEWCQSCGEQYSIETEIVRVTSLKITKVE